VPWVYILRCGDNTFYVGHSDDLKSRVRWHRTGLGARHTARRLPVDLVYKERHPSTLAAVERERQIKRWSAEKKAALISGDLAELKRLSKRRRTKARRVRSRPGEEPLP
jgi:predicted GIY-YIG superfamily endonuclease